MTPRSSARREIQSEDPKAGPRLVGSTVAGDLGDPPRGAAGGWTLQGLASSFAARPTLLLVALFVYALAFQGSRGLWEPDEGRYTAVALEMERLSDYLVPRLNYESIHLTKPPVTYWLMAASMELLGRNEWAARLPNAIAFVATILVVAAMGRRLAPRATLPPGLVYALSLLPVAAANVIGADTLLTLWETLAVYGFAELWWGPPEGARRYRVLLWLALGIAFLTKGPPGLIALIPIGVFALSTAGWRGARRLVSWPSLLVFLTVGLSWYLIIVATTPGAFSYLVRREVFDRMFTGSLDRNAGWLGPIEAYLPVVLLGWLPWIGEVRAGLRATGRIVRPAWWRERRAHDSTGYFLALWLAIPLAIFMVVRSRMPLYLLPLAVPTSLLIARQGVAITASRRRLAAIAVWIAVLVLGRGALALRATSKDSRALAHAILATAPVPPTEAVFAETQARYGVALYLDAEVERVSIYPPVPPLTTTEFETLSHELAEPAGARVFVVSSEDVESFRNAMRQHGLEVEKSGSWRQLSFFWAAGDAAATAPTGEI